MSTRATVHFCDSDKETHAIVYKHGDGYPEGLGEDIKVFLKEVQDKVSDNRFHDPSYLAAKFVVWQSQQMVKKGNHYLDFISVGVMNQDPGDIEYRYKIICKDCTMPEIIIEKV